MDTPRAPDVARLLLMLGEQSREHAVLLFDPSGRITWASPGAERTFGYEAGGLAGMQAAEVFVPEDVERGLAGHEMEVALRNGVAEDDRWQKRRDGSRFWAVGALVALHDEAGRMVAFAKVLRDRTDLKEQIEALRNHVLALGEDARRKDAFLSTLSHELRNPLAPLANAVIQLEREAVVIQEVLRQSVEDARALINERRHAVEVIVPAEPNRLAADGARLHQVFVNLVTNAAKYTPPEGRIWVLATVEGHEAVVKVSDNGVGIPREMLPRIFDLFTRVESSRTPSRGGLGIGLALVKDLVAMHGGSVQVRSEGAGKGSEFTVRLPLGTAEREEPMRR